MLLFVNRSEELERLQALVRRGGSALAVVSGRRRIGKTRLLLEWARHDGGMYSVADQSAPDVQRRYVAEAIDAKLPGFADVSYPNWGALLARLARDARTAGFRGPVVFDELPHLVLASPELPSVLQRWMDHEAKDAELVVALAGSSQRMMQGLVLDRSAPLYGRADEILELAPLGARHLRRALGARRVVDVASLYAAWGGVPRYWELAKGASGSLAKRIDALVLSPLGPLHREPDLLLLEEVPAATEVRPILDAIGAGAHRVSEIGSRLGRPATSISRPLDRLIGMGLVRREVPFGEPERRSRRSLYRLDDPFFRLWFRVVAPNRAALSVASPEGRRSILDRQWEGLVSLAWEELCRASIPKLDRGIIEGLEGPLGPASRWWRGRAPEWDLVASTVDGSAVLLGEVKWSARPLSRRKLEDAARLTAAKTPPVLPKELAGVPQHRVLLVPETTRGAARRAGGVGVLTGAEVLGLSPPRR